MKGGIDGQSPDRDFLNRPVRKTQEVKNED
jgi:hypothetical protein